MLHHISLRNKTRNLDLDPNLSIISWNCRSILSNLSVFKIFLYSNKPHIVCLCETWLKPSKEPTFINYTCIWKHRTGLQQGGGLAFLIRNDIHYGHKTLNVLNNSKLEVQAIKIIANSELTIDLLNLYNLNEIFLPVNMTFFLNSWILTWLLWKILIAITECGTPGGQVTLLV